MDSKSFLNDSYNDSNDEVGEFLFYTPKLVQHLDDKEIIEEIFYRYPPLLEANRNKEEIEERKVFLIFMQEKDIIDSILAKYNISIIDLIKIFYRHFSYIFNTVTYTNKVKTIIEQNEYSLQAKL